MENNNQSPPSPPPPPAASSSSFTTKLFGDDDSQPASTGMFASVFPSPSSVARNYSCVHLTHPMRYETLDTLFWSTIDATSADNVAKNNANANSGVVNMNRKSIFLERIEPCPLSSSISYGGLEDMYIVSSTDLTSRSCTKFFMKEDSKDDPNHLRSATRGNWWEGSLYY